MNGRLRAQRFHDALARHVDRGAVPGVVALVEHRGATQVEALGARSLGGPPMSTDTIFRIASMTKPVVAAAAMMLVEECRLRLDDPIDPLLPELAARRVLRQVSGPLDDTVPARRPVTLRDLLTLRLGLGYLMEDSSGYPIQHALDERGLLQGPPRPRALPPPDDWLRQVGELPLMAQPGTWWGYDLGLDVLGVLVARAAGQPLGAFLHERLFSPLGMVDTGFHVPPEKRDRLATAYEPDPATGALTVYDSAAESEWADPPAFPAAASGLVSTALDYLAFGRLMLAGGVHGRERILARATVERMTTNHLAPSQQEASRGILGDSRGWGFGLAVTTRRDGWANVGSFGWDGGLGTSWAADPREEFTGILLTQVAWTSPEPPAMYHDFWASAYQAIPD